MTIVPAPDMMKKLRRPSHSSVKNTCARKRSFKVESLANIRGDKVLQSACRLRGVHTHPRSGRACMVRGTYSAAARTAASSGSTSGSHARPTFREQRSSPCRPQGAAAGGHQHGPWCPGLRAGCGRNDRQECGRGFLARTRLPARRFRQLARETSCATGTEVFSFCAGCVGQAMCPDGAPPGLLYWPSFSRSTAS